MPYEPLSGDLEGAQSHPEHLEPFHSPNSGSPALVDDFEIEEMPFKAAAPAGNSTLGQTVFNAVNVLVGMGVLCLPLGLKLAGWIAGLLMLVLAPVATWYTALLLGRVLDVHPPLETYSDIGRYTLSRPLYVALLTTFMLDLSGAALTLTILFADSFGAITGLGHTPLRAIMCLALFGLSFLPLRLLAKLSMMGVASMAGIILVLAGGGLSRTESPGSIRNPMPTNLWPESLSGFLIAVGIIMAPWAGHVVFPELHRDMKNPRIFKQAVTATYCSAWIIEASTASIGFLMFGALTLPEITSNILQSDASPIWLLTLITVFLGLLPIAKLPLFTLPVISFVAGVLPLEDSKSRIASQAIVAVTLFVISSFITDFGRVQSILGSVICVVTCITAPLAFYIVVFPQPPKITKVFYSAILGSLVLSVFCTIAVFVG